MQRVAPAPSSIHLETAVKQCLGKSLKFLVPLPGVHHAQCYRGCTKDDQELFVKVYAKGRRAAIEGEAAGLQAIRETGAIDVPKVFVHDEKLLITEHIENHQPSRKALERLGRGLALLHEQSSTLFGFSTDTYLGGTRQPNDWEGSGPLFYRVKRFLHMLQLLRKKGTLPPESGPLDRLVERLDEWLPNHTPSLTHGDFWAGNVLFGSDDRPYLVDPAAYYGYREADLAMSQLFGGFDSVFYGAYHEAFPLDAGYKTRKELFNLYHILHHALIFGGGYLAQAYEIAEHFVG